MRNKFDFLRVFLSTKGILFWCVFFPCGHSLFAQADPQFTQFYANALYLNPAFAGSEQSSRAFVMGRLQWPGISGTHTTGAASFDHYFTKYKSGIGAIVTQDYIPASGLSALDIGLQYSYQLDISQDVTFRPGLQIGMGRRSIDYSKLNFNNQFTDDGLSSGLSNNENFKASKIPFYADVSAGGLLLVKNAWLGIATHHMNRPIQTFNGDQSNRIAMSTTFHGGYKFLLGPQRPMTNGVRQEVTNEEKSISPAFQYKMQGKWDQLDIGLYGRYDFIVLGLWYRGLPVKVYKTESANQDAFSILLGFIYYDINIGYSYDITISKLTNKSGGSHELTLSHKIPSTRPKKIRARKVNCPKF